MKLARIGDPGNEIPIAIRDHEIYDVRPVTADTNPDFVEAGGFALVSAAVHDEALPLLDVLDTSIKRCGPRSHGRKR